MELVVKVKTNPTNKTIYLQCEQRLMRTDPQVVMSQGMRAPGLYESPLNKEVYELSCSINSF